MNLEQLQTVAAIRRFGSFRAAAHELHLSQPAISGQIRRLEDELGTRLFDRRGRRCSLTAAGEAVACRAEEILRILAEIRRELPGAGAMPPRFRLACGEFLSSGVAPDVLSALRARYPESEVSLEIGLTTEEMLHRLREERLELALAMLPSFAERPPDLGFRRFAVEELKIVCGPGDPLAREGDPTPLLRRATWLLNERGRGMREMVEKAFGTRGWKLQALVVDRIAAMKELARRGIGVAALPEHFVEAEIRRCELIALDPPKLRLRMTVAGVFQRVDSEPPWLALGLRASRLAVQRHLR